MAPPPQRITVLGDGQMGLVCCAVLAEHASRPAVTLWGHNRADLSLLAQRRSSARLPGFMLPAPEAVRVEPDLAEAVTDANLIISAVPAQHIRSVWERLRGIPDALGQRCAVVSVAKGIENGTLLRPTEVVLDALGERPPENFAAFPAGGRSVAALSGPTIATELARCLPATMVAAASGGPTSPGGSLTQEVQRLFTTSWLRTYTSADLVGVELAGALKNVIAIAAGALDGLHAGANAKSALLARGLAEIVRLGVAMGAKPETFFGIAGVGDLATSCFSPEGRNRSLGEALGRGERLEDALANTTSVIEGVATAKSVVELARRHGVEMPIAQAVHAVLFEGVDPIEAITGLMRREVKAERVG